MDPTPAPELGPFIEATDNLVSFAAWAFAGLIVVLVLVIILVWAIYKSAQFQPQAMLVIVLGVLALVASIGYFVGGDERAELITLAAAAVGALAGALTLMTNKFVEQQREMEEVERKMEEAEAEESEEPPADDDESEVR